MGVGFQMAFNMHLVCMLIKRAGAGNVNLIN